MAGVSDVIITIFGAGGFISLVVQFWIRQREKKTDKAEKTESEIISMLKTENLKLGKEILELRKDVQIIREELHKEKIKVERYEQSLGLTLSVIRNLKSINEDETAIIESITKSLTI